MAQLKKPSVSPKLAKRARTLGKQQSTAELIAAVNGQQMQYSTAQILALFDQILDDIRAKRVYAA